MKEEINEDKKLIVEAVLKQDAYLTVNKTLINNVGLHEAIIISDLLSKEKYFEKKNQLDDEGFFYNTQENIKKDTILSEYQQLKAIRKIENIGIIETKYKGMPSKKYYKINYTKLLRNLETSFLETEKQDSEKLGNKIPRNLETSFLETENQVSKKLGTNKNNRIKNNRIKNNEDTPLTPLGGNGVDNESLGEVLEEIKSDLDRTESKPPQPEPKKKKKKKKKQTRNKNPEDIEESKLISKVIGIFAEINNSIKNDQKFYSRENQRGAVRFISKIYGPEKTIELANKAVELREVKGAPIITTPLSLQTKLADLEIFIKRQEGSSEKFKAVVGSDFSKPKEG